MNSNQPVDESIPRFHVRPILDQEKTDTAGYPVFRDVEYVEIIVRNSKNFRPCYRVQKKHQDRWPQQYASFKNNLDGIEDGYRLDEWSMMPRSMAETLKSLQIYTMEQFVSIPPEDLNILGPGVPDLQKQAEKVLGSRDEKQEQLDKLQEQNEALMARLEALEGAQTAPKKSPAKTRSDNLAKARAAKKAKAEAAAAGG